MTARNVALVHNAYQQPGGEDEVFLQEASMLRAFGHSVITFQADNHEIASMGRVRLAAATIWNAPIRAELRSRFRAAATSVAHFHNTFPLISPSSYSAARDVGAAVVQTLHNFRLLCPNVLFFRDGRPCEQCLPHRFAWPGIVHGCYRGSRTESAAVATMVSIHRAIGTWSGRVDAYIALSQFARAKFVAGGLPAERIHVKPNFLSTDPGAGTHRGGYALYVGRLSVEKGVNVLLDAWKQIGKTIPLKIVGAGPLEARLANLPPSVEWLGRRSRDEVLRMMRDASFLVVPSACYENFPMTMVEAFATGLPVIGSDHGSVAELIAEDRNGYRFLANSAEALAMRVEHAVAHPHDLRALGNGARAEYEAKYTASANHAALMSIYDASLRQRGNAA